MQSSPSKNMCACSESFYYETKIFANGILEEGTQKPKEAVKIDQNAIALISKGSKLGESSAVASMPVGGIFKKFYVYKTHILWSIFHSLEHLNV